MRGSTLRIAVCIIILPMTACESLDPEKFNANMAKYAVLPTNKAVYMHPDHYHMNWAYGLPTVQAAVEKARTDCETHARNNNQDPNLCYPVAVNGKQFWDPSASIVTPDQQRQSLQDFDQMMQTLPGMVRH
jgi:hypothetical protein